MPSSNAPKEPTMPKVAVVHPLLQLGGSEVVAMNLIEALSESFDVTLITSGVEPIPRLNALAGTHLVQESFSVTRVPGARGLPAGLRGALVARAAHRIRARFDLMISAYNPMTLGTPAIHFIQDFSFDPCIRTHLHPPAEGIRGAWYRPGLSRRLYNRILDRISPRHVPRKTDLYVANSRWTRDMLRKEVNVESQVVYPPVPGCDPSEARKRDGLGFVWLGRWAPEKRVEETIAILDSVRQNGYPVTLHLIGEGTGPYAKRIRSMASRHDWIVQHGYVAGPEKQLLLASNSFGISTCKNEAFGIAVAEMAQAGCLPFVPASGGQTEIVEDERLLFRSHDEAVERILALLRSPQAQLDLGRKLAKGMQRFSIPRFKESVARIMDPDAGWTGEAASQRQDPTPEAGQGAYG